MDKSIVVVLFEVTPKEGLMDEYLDMASTLKEELSKTQGLISIERFSSLSIDGKLLSMSVWESEEALLIWRNNIKHREYQKYGRDNIFEKYHLTISSPIRMYTKEDRAEAPLDSNEFFGL